MELIFKFCLIYHFKWLHWKKLDVIVKRSWIYLLFYFSEQILLNGLVYSDYLI